MLTTSANTEPDMVSQYFDKRGWPTDSRNHAEVVEVFRPRAGWSRFSPRKCVSNELLHVLAAEGVTLVTLRCRYSNSRTVSADFKIGQLL